MKYIWWKMLSAMKCSSYFSLHCDISTSSLVFQYFFSCPNIFWIMFAMKCVFVHHLFHFNVTSERCHLFFSYFNIFWILCLLFQSPTWKHPILPRKTQNTIISTICSNHISFLLTNYFLYLLSAASLILSCFNSSSFPIYVEYSKQEAIKHMKHNSL